MVPGENELANCSLQSRPIDIKASFPQHQGMRTTITLEPDVARELEQLRREQNTTFKDAVNSALRAGLTVLTTEPTHKRGRYRIRPASVGTPRLPSLDNIADILELDTKAP
jgi:hypothetical protein